MYTNEEINDYVNNHDPNTMHMGLEEFTLYRRHGPDDETTDTHATAETQARVFSCAIARQDTGPKLYAVRPRLAHQHHWSYNSEGLCRLGSRIW